MNKQFKTWNFNPKSRVQVENKMISPHNLITIISAPSVQFISGEHKMIIVWTTFSRLWSESLCFRPKNWIFNFQVFHFGQSKLRAKGINIWGLLEKRLWSSHSKLCMIVPRYYLHCTHIWIAYKCIDLNRVDVMMENVKQENFMFIFTFI